MPESSVMSAVSNRLRTGPTDRRGALIVLLASLVVLQFGYPVTDYGPGWTVTYLLVYGVVIWFGMRSVAANPRRHWPILVGSVLTVAGGTWFSFQQDERSAQAAMLVGVGLLQLALVVTVVGALIKPPQHAHTVDLLLIAVCAYLLLGGVFGVGASLVEIAHPGSYADNTLGGTLVPWQTLFYGSYVTLSTLGFGDVVPVASWARSLSSLQAVTGTLFVAVVIARLVGVAGLAARDTTPQAQ